MKSRWNTARWPGCWAMSRILLLPCVLWLPCSIASGQTNTPPSPGPAPALPALALGLPAERKQSPPTITLSETTHPVGEFSLLQHSDKPLEATNPPVRMGEISQARLVAPNAAFFSTATAPMYFRPDWQWRELPIRPRDVSKPAPASLAAPAAAPVPAQQETEVVPFELNREMDPHRMALVERLRGAGLLDPPRPEFDSDIDRAVAHFFWLFGLR